MADVMDAIPGYNSRGQRGERTVRGNDRQPTALHYDLAHRIVEHARWSDLGAGAHLRETELAGRFRVSRSPIRAALKLLAERDIVEYTRHHGVFLRIPGRDLDPDLIGDMTTPEQDLYRRMVHDRLAGTLPDILSVAELGRLYAVSRSRLTRLLGHMANEGLVERLPGHRWRFNPALTSEELYDSSYRFRLIIEPATFLEPGFLTEQSELEELNAAHARLIDGEVWQASYSYLYQVDAAFHETVGRWSHNAFLIQAIRHQNRLRRLTEYEYYADRERMLGSCHEHAAILDAVASGRMARASELMRHHINASWRSRPRFPANPGGGDLSRA